MNKLSLAITTYNRYTLTMLAFANVYDHPLIDEIVIVDDHSNLATAQAFKSAVRNKPKIKFFRNEMNIGMAANKCRAVSLCKNDWVILFDSDNVLTEDYLNNIPDDRTDNVIYCPDFAKPNFDYTPFSGRGINADNIKDFFKVETFGAFLNTCNYVVNKEKYVETWAANDQMKGTDTIWFNYLWLKGGGEFYVVKGMWYKHLVHPGSEFIKDITYNMEQAAKIENLIKQIA